MTHSDCTSNDRVLKVDKRGRVRSTPAQREAVLAEFERSGLSGTKFAVVAGINYQTFAGWLAKRRRAGNAPRAVAMPPGTQAGSMRWVEAVVGAGGVGQPALSVDLRAMRLEIKSASQVPLAAALLRALEAREGWPC